MTDTFYAVWFYAVWFRVNIFIGVRWNARYIYSSDSACFETLSVNFPLSVLFKFRIFSVFISSSELILCHGCSLFVFPNNLWFWMNISFFFFFYSTPYFAMTSLSEKALFFWDWRWLTTALVFLISFHVMRFYRKVSKYPKGPFPLPVVGNLLSK